MNTRCKRSARRARAHLALLDLKKVVDEATQRTHAAELEAVHWQYARGARRNIHIIARCSGTSRFAELEATLSRVRETLQIAMS